MTQNSKRDWKCGGYRSSSAAAPLRDVWAYRNIQLRGTAAGEPMIVVNKLLETTPEAVPDDVLHYLLHHELLHHLLPGQGHDGQF